MAEAGLEPRYRILVVDDDPDTVRVIRSLVGGKPYEVLDAANGEDGLKLAVAERPDLILLDLRMPGRDGISVARELRQDERTRLIPVILLTAIRDLDAKVEAFGAGVDDYVTKPFALEEIDARIQSNLRRGEFLRGLQVQVQDLSADKQQLEQSLQLDDKTGLYNFREFQRRLKQEWERASRYRTPLSLVFLDVDHFKAINDRLGHQAGDRVLREFAILVQGTARANDVAARYGGEEFALILPHTDDVQATRVADRLLRSVREFVFIEDETPTRMTVSAGLANYPATSGIDSVDTLVRAADVALYRAKDAGRDCVVVAEESPAPATEVNRTR
jgi:diguanylate cyclase (GGDEF)-like protein